MTTENNYWLNRKKVGRPKIIKSPKQLWGYFCDYAHHISNNPFKKQDFVRGGDLAGTIVELDTIRPFTWEGFEDFLFEKDIIFNLKDYRFNKNGAYDEFSAIITRIGDIIYNQKFEGAAVGAFNANIIARDLGLSDKSEIKADVNNKHQVDYSKLSESALEEIAAQSKYKADDRG